MNKKSASPVVVTASGRLDSVEAAPLRATINNKLASGQHRIIVDLTDVDFLDSAGLAALVIGMKRARMANGDLRLVLPRSLDARRVFELTKFDDIFVVAETLDGLDSEWTGA